jgi:hypothetical protein
MYRVTQLATQLEAKILRPMAYNKQLTKPLLVITVTDGEPTDSPKDKIVDVIQECSRKLHSRGLGPHAVAFQFAQVCEAMHGLCSTQLAPCCFCFQHLHSRIPMCVRPRSSGHFARPTCRLQHTRVAYTVLETLNTQPGRPHTRLQACRAHAVRLSHQWLLTALDALYLCVSHRLAVT